MTTKKLFSQLQHLSRDEKLNVIKFLMQELESEEEDLSTIDISKR